MEDLSQSTISTPIRDLRQQMVISFIHEFTIDEEENNSDCFKKASKIRTWRLAIQDLEEIEEFPSWSPSPNTVSILVLS